MSLMSLGHQLAIMHVIRGIDPLDAVIKPQTAGGSVASQERERPAESACCMASESPAKGLCRSAN